MNTKIMLSENRNSGAVLSLSVGPAKLRELERLQDAGGFLRYSIDIWGQTDQPSNTKGLKEFLRAVFTFTEMEKE